jgi:hypothetical protein
MSANMAKGIRKFLISGSVLIINTFQGTFSILLLRFICHKTSVVIDALDFAITVWVIIFIYFLEIEKINNLRQVQIAKKALSLQNNDKALNFISDMLSTVYDFQYELAKTGLITKVFGIVFGILKFYK